MNEEIKAINCVLETIRKELRVIIIKEKNLLIVRTF